MLQLSQSKIIVLFCLVCTNTWHLHSQEEEVSRVRIMFYNVENLFDIYNDSLTQDDEFIPSGVRRWNDTRYQDKVNKLYKTIVAVGNDSPPSIIGLCEVENLKVLKDLVFGTYLSKFKYQIVHQDSPDPRGIDVALLYRPDLCRRLYSGYIFPAGFSSGDFKTRTVLYSVFLIGKDTLHLFLNHWPSRRGGALAGESTRKAIAEMVKDKADSVVKISDNNLVVVAGDFNCTPSDAEMIYLAGDEKMHSMVNLSDKPSQQGEGTYKYQGRWEMIDQVLVSWNLLSRKDGLHADRSMVVFKPDFLLVSDPLYPGLMPFSTYRGFKYQGGFSDHLPVYLDLQ